MQNGDENSQRPGVRALADLVGEFFSLPRAWVLGVVFAVIVSLFEVTRESGGGISVTVHVTTITAILIAIAWLPALLKVVAVVGGGFKTPAGEVSTEGLLDILRQSDAAMKREVLPAVIGALSIAEKQTPEARKYRGLFERELSGSIAPDSRQAKRDLQVALEDYKRLRELPFGPERTAKVSTAAARIRALALRSQYTSEELARLLEDDPQTGMIALLGLLQSQSDPKYFEIVLREVENPSGPQEQYLALVAIDTMLPLLTSEQQKRVAEAIRTQQYIKPENEGRWTVSREILARIR